jgi:hypothetical protein
VPKLVESRSTYKDSKAMSDFEGRWRARQREGCEKQVAQLRRRWEQAHYEAPIIGTQDDYFDWLIVVPGMTLPHGWSATICTVLMQLRSHNEHSGPLNGFFVDIPDLRIASDMRRPKYSRTDGAVLWEVEEVDPMWRQNGWEQAAEKVFANRERHWIAGHPQWRGLTRFWWRAQQHNPNYDTFYTAAMLCRQRLRMVI